MVLRLQGDSPVRICNPCKNLEEAARFELRHGHKSRAVKGTSKQSLKHEDEILNQILGTSGKQEPGDITTSDLLRAASTASSSLNEESAAHGREGDRDTLVDVESCSPEELRQQAVEEKKKYKILKGEGKSDEALQTFKRAKELERQAGALEIAIRKNRRLASKSTSLSSVASNQKIDNSEESTSKKNLPQRKGKEEKDDLAAELRDLGWSDADLHDADNKPVKLSVEGELSNLLGEISQSSSSNRKTGGVDKSQVVALKKKALQLKREGKLAEAKEELKRAKILEKQLEEQELLGDSEESDDELSALIRNMDDDKHDDFLLNHPPVPNINFDQFGILSDDLVIDNNFDVTDDDMNDPELANALRSFGWTEEEDDQAIDDVGQPNLFDQEALRGKILTLKREALSQKRVGNVAEAMTLLKKAKLLEKDLETVQSDTQASQENVPKSSVSRVYGESVAEIADEENIAKLPRKSKIAIQKELLAIKKKALALRREGRTNEADEELQKGKLLEQQLEEMENGPKRPVPKVAQKNASNLKPDNIHMGDPGTLDLGDVGEEAEVTEQDMHDPALMSVLKNLGWNEEDTDPVSMTNRTAHDSTPPVISRKPRSKTEIQRELLALKRKALGLRRQGKTEEAEEELEKAKDLERQLAEMEASSIAKSTEVQSQDLGTLIPKVKPDFIHKADGDLSSLMSRIVKDEENYLKREDTKNPSPSSSLSVPEITGTEWESFGKPGHVTEEGSSNSVSAFSQSEGINPFRHSSIDVSHSREKADRECSRDPKFSPPTASVQPTTQVIAKESNNDDNVIAHKLVTPEQKTLGINAQRDEILARKRKAVALKREGKLAEAREELKQAKLLEKSLEEANQQTVVETTAEVASTSNSPPVIRESKTNQQAQKPLSGRDRFKLQQESLAHKRKALKLRREGKIEESEAEFELAKALESQLEDFDTQGSNTNTVGKVEGMNDVGVEDLLDPQLMSALKSIGWDDSDMGAHQPTGAQPSKKLELPPTVSKGGKPQGERTHLEDMIKAEKVRALNLKREGKQGEALEALRSAKLLEKKLGSLT